jgi:hypothetical protein
MHTAAPAEDMPRFPHASDMPPRHIAFLFQETESWVAHEKDH